MEHRDALTAERKTVISREIVDKLVQNGGRFLIKGKSWWTICGRETAREKVSVAFRDMRKTCLLLEKRKISVKTSDDNSSDADDDKKRKISS